MYSTDSKTIHFECDVMLEKLSSSNGCCSARKLVIYDDDLTTLVVNHNNTAKYYFFITSKFECKVKSSHKGGCSMSIHSGFPPGTKKTTLYEFPQTVNPCGALRIILEYFSEAKVSHAKLQPIPLAVELYRAEQICGRPVPFYKDYILKHCNNEVKTEGIDLNI